MNNMDEHSMPPANDPRENESTASGETGQVPATGADAGSTAVIKDAASAAGSRAVPQRLRKIKRPEIPHIPDLSKTAQGMLARCIRRVTDNWVYLAAFCIPALLLYIAYAVFEVHPWGDNSVLVLDLNGQYVYYYERMRDALWGDASMIYSWSRSLSGEMFGVFAYYLASPFMIIPCILPRTWMLGAIELVQILKIGTAAVTFAFCCRRFGNRNAYAVLAGAISYALMAYMIVELMDPMWLDGLIYLPLIVWGVHRLVDEGRILPFAIPLSLMFIAHFYIGYMVGIFTGIYFILRFFTCQGRILPKRFVSVLFKFIFGTLTAILAASAVLITVYNSLKLGKFEFTEPDLTLKTQFDLFTFFTKLFPMSYDTVRPEGLPVLYCGVLTLIMVPLYFMNSKINIKEKVCNGLAAAILMASMYIAPLDIIWHGLQVPNWLPYRYSFIFCFMLVFMAYRALDNLDGISFKDLGGAVFALFVLVVYLEHEGVDYLKTFDTETVAGVGDVYSIQSIWLTLLALLVYFGVVHIIKGHKSAAAAVVLVIAVGGECYLNTIDTIRKIDKDVVYSTYSSYYDYMIDGRDAVKMINSNDSTFFRTEATFHRTVNDPVGMGYAGISHSSSTMNTPAMLALKYLGYAYGGNYTKYDGATPLTDAVFGIKYLMNRTDGEYESQKLIPEDYALRYTTQQTGSPIEVYQNPYALGLGIVSDKRITDLTFDPMDPFANQNALLNSLLSTDSDVDFFQTLTPYETADENVMRATASGGYTKYSYSDETNYECHLDYVFKMKKTQHMYMFLPTQYERKVNVWVKTDPEYADAEGDFDFIDSFFEGDDYSIMDLGEYQSGESVRVRISIPTTPGEAYWTKELFCTLDTDALKTAVATLKDRQWKLTEHTDTYLEGTVTAQNDQVLFTTIPYEEGWTIRVDGQEVSPLVSAGTFITIPLTAGTHTVTMKFLPNYFIMGLVLSAFGVLVFVLIFLFEYKDGVLILRLLGKQKNKEKAQIKAIDKR
ncbi:MAG: YfhO family protein [Oscillospiraceae bacterium]